MWAANIKRQIITVKKRYLLFLLLIALVAGGLWFFRKPPASGPTPDEMVKELLEFDQNGDGQLSRDEVPERMQGLFARGDANQDGVLRQDELHKLAETQAAAARRNERERR